MRVVTKVVIEHGDAVWRALDAVKMKDVADHFGVKQVILSHWKSGRIMMPWDQYVKMCEYLGVKHD